MKVKCSNCQKTFHAPDEWVSIPEVAASARIVTETVRRFLA